MMILDIGPPVNSPEHAKWLAENAGPVLVQMDDEAPERDAARYLRRNPHDNLDARWGTVDKSSGAFIPSGIEPVDPDFSHARGTSIGEQLARQRVEEDQRRRELAACDEVDSSVISALDETDVSDGTADAEAGHPPAAALHSA